MKESLAHEELARTASAVSSLAHIRAEPTKSAQLHCVRCGFLPLLAHLLNSTSFLIVLFCYVVLRVTVLQSTTVMSLLLSFFPQRDERNGSFSGHPLLCSASSQGGGSPT